jgi:hypothetical protein
MKKIWLFVFLGLTLASLPLFAGGALDGGDKTSRAGEVPEMPTENYPAARRRPNLTPADSDVYALPSIPLKPDAERLPPPVYAVSGVKGQEIYETGAESPRGRMAPVQETVDIVVQLPQGVKFVRGLLEGADVSDWIGNLPKGLEARAHRTRKGATTIRIYVSGTPEITMREVIRVTIPGTYLTGGSARNFVSPNEEESLKAWEASLEEEE